MKSVRAILLSVGFLLMGGALIITGQTDTPFVSDDEADTVMGGECKRYEKTQGCKEAGCTLHDHYTHHDNGGLENKDLRSVGQCGSNCGFYYNIKICSDS